MKMTYPSGVIKQWINSNTIDVLIDLGFKIFTEQRFRLAGLGDDGIDITKTNIFSDIIQKIAPVNTRVKVDCYGSDGNNNWICDVVLPDGRLLNTVLFDQMVATE